MNLNEICDFMKENEEELNKFQKEKKVIYKVKDDNGDMYCMNIKEAEILISDFKQYLRDKKLNDLLKNKK